MPVAAGPLCCVWPWCPDAGTVPSAAVDSAQPSDRLAAPLPSSTPSPADQKPPAWTLAPFALTRRLQLKQNADCRFEKTAMSQPPLRPLSIAPVARPRRDPGRLACIRSEEHTSELQSRENLVCRL